MGVNPGTAVVAILFSLLMVTFITGWHVLITILGWLIAGMVILAALSGLFGPRR